MSDPEIRALSARANRFALNFQLDPPGVEELRDEFRVERRAHQGG